MGFRQVVVLQSGDEDRYTDSIYEAQLRAKQTDPSIYSFIDVIYIRCSNIFPPNPKQVESFLEICGNGKPTYVHCHSGVDRTGFLVAVYQMVKLGWTFSRAYYNWVLLGRHWWFDWWKYELNKYGGKRDEARLQVSYSKT